MIVHRGSGARPALVLLVFAVLALGACGIDTATIGTKANGDTTKVGDSNGVKPQITVPSTTTSTVPAKPFTADDLVSVAADVQSFWKTELPAVYGKPYRTIPSTRIIAGFPGGTFPVCDGDQITYKDVEGNALGLWQDA